MSRLVPVLVLTLAGLGCGSSGPDTSSITGKSTSVASEFGVSANASGVEPANATGLLSPVRVTLRVADLGIGGGAIDSGTVAIRDAQGNVLASAAVPKGISIPSAGVGEASVTLEWSGATQAGKRVEWKVSAHAGNGQAFVFADTLTLP